jgi:hypothetical protein
LGCGRDRGARTTDHGRSDAVYQASSPARTPLTQPLEERISEALNPSDIEPWHSALLDLITILGDSDDAYDSIQFTDVKQLDAMRRNWRQGASDDELSRRIARPSSDLRLARLKSVVRICPGSSTENSGSTTCSTYWTCIFQPGSEFAHRPARGFRAGEKQYEGQFFDAEGSLARRTRFL